MLKIRIYLIHVNKLIVATGLVKSIA